MITAIPMKKNCISNHFAKAESFIFLDENGNLTSTSENPALNASCSGKTELRELLARNNAQRIVVRHIGERMLEKLLENNFSVFQVARGQEVSELLLCDSNLMPLTHAEQGRASLNYESKMKNGGCGCEHGNIQKAHNHNHNHKKENCCDNKKSDQTSLERRGQGRCSGHN